MLPNRHQRKSLRRHVFEALEGDPKSGRTGEVVQFVLLSVVVASIVALVIESVPEIRARAPGLFSTLEIGFVAIFTIEYVLRLWSCTAAEPPRSAVWGRARFAGKPMMIVDLIVILPFYLPFLGVDFRVARLLRLMRLARVFKLARYTRAANSIRDAFLAKRSELTITFGFLLVLLLFSASVMYFAERDAQPEVFGTIPKSMWWAIVTLTTVGYGDVVPITPLGRVAASFIAVVGVGFIALPTGILGSAFVEELGRRRNRLEGKCPTCGKRFESAD